ncbi:MAG: hypothetical protein WDN49_21155 [Acetobacteraceae bacterium]
MNFLEDYGEGQVSGGRQPARIPHRAERPARATASRPSTGCAPASAMVFQQFNLWPHMTVLQ